MKSIVLAIVAIMSVGVAHADPVFQPLHKRDKSGEDSDKSKATRPTRSDGDNKSDDKNNRPSPPRAQPPRPPRDDHDRDRDKDKNRNDRDHRDHDWHHSDWDDHHNYEWRPPQRTVIIERPVYVPTYDPYYDNAYNRYDEYNREDEQLEALARQIKTALRTDPTLQPFYLDTDTVGDSVELEGCVDNISQVQLALDVARDIDPKARIVITRLKIRP